MNASSLIVHSAVFARDIQPRNILKVRHYMGLHWKYPLEQQEVTTAMQKQKIKKALDEFADEVEFLLNLALRMGRVVIVTLAKEPWVSLSCENFFPAKIAKLIEDNNISIVYAQVIDAFWG